MDLELSAHVGGDFELLRVGHGQLHLFGRAVGLKVEEIDVFAQHVEDSWVLGLGAAAGEAGARLAAVRRT